MKLGLTRNEFPPVRFFGDGSDLMLPLHQEVFEVAEPRDLLHALVSTRTAVIRETGHHATHFLIGWKSLVVVQGDELRRYVTEYRSSEGFNVPVIDGIPIYLDPTKGESVVAVPVLRWLIGREMLPSFSWVPPCREHEDCRAHPEIGSACSRSR
jgi:hypothetical protein